MKCFPHAFFFIGICFFGFLSEKVSAQNAAGHFLSERHYKHRVVEKIVVELAAAMAKAPPYPRIGIIDKSVQSGKIAEASLHPTSQILLNEKTYDLCASMGADSLAALSYIIGHEMVHIHHHGDAYCASFVYEPNNGHAAASLQERNRMETEADQKACLYAYMAGYAAHRAMPTILDKIYQSFGLDDENQQQAGYPSRMERTAIAIDTKTQLQRYIPVAETGELALVLGKYDLAIRCYEFLLQRRLVVPEFYMMAGSAYLCKALAHMHQEGFQYPLMFDSNSFLDNTRSEVEEIAEGEGIEIILQKAEKYLDIAVRPNGDYSPAIVNLASVLILSGKTQEAIFKIKDRLKGQLETSPVVQTILGISLFHDGQTQEAFHYLEKAAASQKDYATYNLAYALAIANGVGKEQAVQLAKEQIKPQQGEWGAVRNPLAIDIGGVTLQQIQRNTEQLDLFVPFNVIKEGEMIKGSLQQKSTAGYWYKRDEAELFFLSGNESSLLQVNMFTNYQQVTAQLGKPSKILEQTQGYYAHYPNAGVIALYNHQHRLIRLTAYYFECLSTQGCD